MPPRIHLAGSVCRKPCTSRRKDTCCGRTCGCRSCYPKYWSVLLETLARRPRPRRKSRFYRSSRDTIAGTSTPGRSGWRRTPAMPDSTGRSPFPKPPWSWSTCGTATTSRIQRSGPNGSFKREFGRCCASVARPNFRSSTPLRPLKRGSVPPGWDEPETRGSRGRPQRLIRAPPQANPGRPPSSAARRVPIRNTAGPKSPWPPIARGSSRASPSTPTFCPKDRTLSSPPAKNSTKSVESAESSFFSTWASTPTCAFSNATTARWTCTTVATRSSSSGIAPRAWSRSRLKTTWAKREARSSFWK